jgi:AraC-like DNA-binding protein
LQSIVLGASQVYSYSQLYGNTTSSSQQEIAQACGFSSQSHFATAFHAEIGVTAGIYRQQNQVTCPTLGDGHSLQKAHF